MRERNERTGGRGATGRAVAVEAAGGGLRPAGRSGILAGVRAVGPVHRAPGKASMSSGRLPVRVGGIDRTAPGGDEARDALRGRGLQGLVFPDEMIDMGFRQ